MIRIALATLALITATPAAQADAWSSLKAWMGQEYCRLYASKCRPAPPPPVVVPVPSPRPPAAPIAPAVEAPPRAAAPAQAATTPAAPAWPARAAKGKPKLKAKPKASAADDGPDLPWPCWIVRLNAAGKSPADLERMGRDSRVTLTPKQQRQARACLAGQ